MTDEAKAVYAGAGEAAGGTESAADFRKPDDRRFAQGVPSWKKPGARVKSKVLSVDAFSIDRDNVDLRGLVQIVDREQTAALAAALKYLGMHVFDGRKTVCEAVDLLFGEIERKGLSVLFDGSTVRMGCAMPRREELIGAVNRWRKLAVRRG